MQASRVLHSGSEKDLWLLSSPLPREEPIGAHLKWIRETIQPHLSFLRFLQARAELRIYCGLTAQAPECKWSISPAELKLLVDLEIPLEMNILL